MICYVLAMGKQHLGPHVIVGYGIKFFSPGLFIMSPDHQDTSKTRRRQGTKYKLSSLKIISDKKSLSSEFKRR